MFSIVIYHFDVSTCLFCYPLYLCLFSFDYNFDLDVSFNFPTCGGFNEIIKLLLLCIFFQGTDKACFPSRSGFIQYGRKKEEYGEKGKIGLQICS